MNRQLWALLGILGLRGSVVADDSSHSVAKTTLVIGVLTSNGMDEGDRGSTASARGIAMGVSEAAITARLFGGAVRAVYAVVAPTARVQAIAGQFATRHPSAILVTSPDLVDVAARYAAEHHAIFINTSAAPASGSLVCSDYYLAISPGEDALASVAARWASRDTAHHAPPAGVATVLWHASLGRFGARELNDRYRAFARGGMNGDAWAGWLGVKLLAEAALRAGSTEPRSLIAYLRTAEFDGHKGWPLSFRSADHALRQPLYIVSARDSATSVFAELPDDRNAAMQTASRTLDEVNPPTGHLQCAPWPR
jgi:hypothetical protein